MVRAIARRWLARARAIRNESSPKYSNVSSGQNLKSVSPLQCNTIFRKRESASADDYSRLVVSVAIPIETVTTTDDATKYHITSKAAAMNDAEGVSVLSPTAHNSRPTEQRLGSEKPHKELFLPPSATRTALNGEAKVALQGRGNNDEAGSAKGDSEAETIIQSGREELSPEKKRTHIQHKTKHNGGKRSHDESTGRRNLATGDDFKMRKRKRIENDHGDGVNVVRQSSRPSSRISSPAPVLKQEGTEESIFNSTPRDILPRPSNVNVARSIEPRKYMEGEAEAEDKYLVEERHGKRGNQDAPYAGRNIRREERHNLSRCRQLSHDRETSPAVCSHKRVLSTSSQSTGRSRKRKSVPPLLLTDHRQHSSEDRESSSPSTRGSPLTISHPHRVPSNEYSAASPAKQMLSSKRQRDQNGRTRLARACAAQEVEVAKSRYEAHPEELDVPDNAGNTPLQIAALEGSVDIVKFLLEAGCDINTKNIDKDTPLIDAVENGHLDVVRLLLDAGANPRVGNAEGDEPYDLVPSDSENYEELRKAIAEAKAKGIQRRKSVDISGHAYSNVPVKEAPSRGASAASPRESPPVYGTRNSPPAGLGRRRTVRSEVTRNDLLWTRATPENLRDFAAKGDIAGVANILNVLQKADTESLIAAAKGSHDEVLGILLGMGSPDPNPEPIKSGNHKPGYNTPMLAAIGRGNNSVIRLLLEQKGFDPTYVDHRGRTYYDISEERKGENWEAEFKLLKEAYDNHVKSFKPGISGVKSPKKSRDISKDVKRRSQEDSVSPNSSQKLAHSPESRNQPQGPQKFTKTKKDGGKDESVDRPSGKSQRRAHRDDVNSEYPTTSDHDSGRSRHTNQKASFESKKQTDSKATASHSEEPIKRRRLIAGRPPDRRRGSVISTDSHSARDEVSKDRVEKFSHETRRVKELSPSKQSRDSVSPEPQQSRGRQGKDDPDPQAKKKRVQTERSPTQLSKETAKRNLAERPRPSKPMSQARTSGSANIVSEKAASNHPMHQEMEPKHIPMDKFATSTQKPQHQVESNITTAVASAEAGVVAGKGAGKIAETQSVRDAEQKRIPVETEHTRTALSTVAVRDAKEAQATQQATTAARELAEEEERKRKEAEQRRVRQAEEEHQKRIEQEFHRQARLRKEQEEQEQRRRDALPHRLRAAANLIGSNDPKAKSLPWLKRFTPVYTVRTTQIDSSCSAEVESDRSHHLSTRSLVADADYATDPSWERRLATRDHRYSLWRMTRSMLSYADELPMLDTYWDDIGRRIAEIKPKFYSMEHVFWVKLSDFIDLVPHISHLHGLDLRLVGMAIFPMPDSEDGVPQTIQGQSGTS
ncbi:hypothetical protein PRK78_000756 [Emydomyces testavorans]|uniref:Ankyrin repeat protein n=1 Tax=Emydomyces testavorans TaxID=2070801 RepID=A0AAF0DD38_9EURO|nr:hypothetical protein PRK78_000756 [Emydomyces testavorans]